MSISIDFTAKVRHRKNLMDRVKDLAEAEDYKIHIWDEELRVEFCPMGDLYISWEQDPENPEQWNVSGECCTTPAGAGFHKAVVDFLDRLENGCMEGMEVDDAAGYYEHRDFERMKREHFYPWLNSLIHICREQMESDTYSNICFCWNLDQYQPESMPGTIVSPMGRFSSRSLAEKNGQEGIVWFADQFFLWDQQEKDARYYRNKAVNLLWEDCCFVPSQRSEKDSRCNRDILDALEKGAAMDPSLTLPIEAYYQVCRLDGRTPIIPESRPEMKWEFPIGYRKGMVTYACGPLRLTLPGCYLYEWEEDEDEGGCDCWWDSWSDSPVWRMNQYCCRDGNAVFTEHIDKEKGLVHKSLTNGKACWGWHKEEDDDEPFFMVTCEAISGSHLFMITISFSRDDERQEIYDLLDKLDTVKEENVVDREETYDGRDL